MERYFRFRGVRRLDYCSSQGCPFECAFCADPQVYKQRWSGLAATRVVAEIKDLAGRYRLSEVFFNDDNFFTDLRRTEAISRGLIEAGVRVRWFGTGRADLLCRLTDEQLRLMRASGCYKVNVGAESGSPALLEEIKKGTLVEEVLETAEKLHRAGIGARFSFIAGFPKEPKESLAETYRTAKALREIDGEFETPIYFYAPYPGTALAERMPALGFDEPAHPRGLGEGGPRPFDRPLDQRSRCGDRCRATTSTCATATRSRAGGSASACSTTWRGPGPRPTSTASTSSAARWTSRSGSAPATTASSRRSRKTRKVGG